MDIQHITHNLGGYFRQGSGYAPCPVCQPERRADQRALSITAKDDKLLVHCFKSGCNFVDIAQAIDLPKSSIEIDQDALNNSNAKRLEYQEIQLSKARSLWDATKPIEGTNAARYLMSRGIKTFPKSLRFMPDIYHAPTSSWCCAMVANIQPCGGVHRTFLSKQGVKLNKSAKMMLGPCLGGCVRLSEGVGPLVVAEGIETSLSLLEMLNNQLPSVCATLSTAGMKSFILPSNAHELIIGVDGDEAGKDAAHKLANRASNTGWKVSLMQAPDGKDFNDVLMMEAVA